jgi:hypothetical protein
MGDRVLVLPHKHKKQMDAEAFQSLHLALKVQVADQHRDLEPPSALAYLYEEQQFGTASVSHIHYSVQVRVLQPAQVRGMEAW